MATQTGYCSVAEVGYYLNSKKLTALADRDRDDSADENVIAWAIKIASFSMYSIFPGRSDYSDTAAMRPIAYTSGTYPQLDAWCSVLAGDISLRGNPGLMTDDPVPKDHFVLELCREVRRGEADIFAAAT